MQDSLERKLRERALLSARVEDDYLAVPDAVLLAALAGRRALSHEDKAALLGSPLTLRRFRELSLQARGRPAAANDAAWRGSEGLLRAAASAGQLLALHTDDGCWTLDFTRHGGAWRVILQLNPAAPFAAHLLAARPHLQVLDGGGALLMQGRLDDDGECEADWPFAAEPSAHLLRAGGAFTVAPMQS